jgi:hypothetical protein
MTLTPTEIRERFLNGLHEELQTYLVAVHYPDLEAMVDATIIRREIMLNNNLNINLN